MISISKRSIGKLEGVGLKSLLKNLKPVVD
jgi:hypothetical protein